VVVVVELAVVFVVVVWLGVVVVLVVEDVLWAAATALEIAASRNVASIFFIGSLPDCLFNCFF